MHIVCKKSDLFHGVQTALNAVSNRNTLPILSNILFESQKDSLKLTSTDLEVSIVCSIPALISAPGNITIPAKKLFDIVRELPDEDVTLKLTENNLVILTCDKSIFKLNGLPKDEYPLLPKLKKEDGVNLAQTYLQDMIKKTIFSVSTDETRYVLNGVLFVVEKDVIRMVSTDGHRLSFIEKKLDKPVSQVISHIVPSKALQELNKILSGEGSVNIQLNENQIIFSSADLVLMSRLIDGQFPNYEQVIPKKSDTSILCNTGKFNSATKRVSLLASDKSNSVKYTFGQNQLLISANTPEVGEAQEEMDIVNPNDTITVAYNAKYVIDAVKNIDTDEFIIELTTNLNPGVFKPKDQSLNYIFVIMPMRI